MVQPRDLCVPPLVHGVELRDYGLPLREKTIGGAKTHRGPVRSEPRRATSAISIGQFRGGMEAFHHVLHGTVVAEATGKTRSRCMQAPGVRRHMEQGHRFGREDVASSQPWQGVGVDRRFVES